MRQDIEEAARVFDEVAAEFGLTVSVLKTMLLDAGSNLEEGDLAPSHLCNTTLPEVSTKEPRYFKDCTCSTS